MNDIVHPQEVLDQLLHRWNLEAGDTERAFGEIAGIPVTMTVLGAEPLALLFGFRIATPHPESVECSEELETLIDGGAVDVSLDDGTAWLTLYRLDCETSDSIGELVEGFGETLQQAGVTPPPGCLSCGATEDVHVFFADDRCQRICSRCIEERVQEQQKAQEGLDRVGLRHVIALPLTFLYVAGGWLLFWYVIDLILLWMKTDEIVIPGEFVVLAVGLVLVAVGFPLGYPLGMFLRKLGFIRRVPLLASLPAIAVACVVGEVFYITAVIYRQLGFFDMPGAVGIFIPFVRGYEPGWAVLKVLVAGAIGLGCYVAMRVKKTAPLRI